MRRLAAVLMCAVIVVALSVPVYARIRPIKQVRIATVAALAGDSSAQPRPEGSKSGQPAKREHSSKWDARDTAVYVVSTLNLLHTPQGRPLSATLLHKGITNYDVYADNARADLYFVELVRDNGEVAGAVAYRMGWLKPVSVSTLTDQLGVSKAQDDIVHAYASDDKQLLDSFTSTLPS